MLELRLNVSEQLLKDRARWLKLRSLLLGEEGEGELAAPRSNTRRPAVRRPSEPAVQADTQPAPKADAQPALQSLIDHAHELAPGEEAKGASPRLFSNLQKAAYALQQLHDSAPNPGGYTAHQMSLFLREQNLEALTAEQLSWALSTMVSRRTGKMFARRIRRGRYLPTEHTRELFA